MAPTPALPRWGREAERRVAERVAAVHAGHRIAMPLHAARNDRREMAPTPAFPRWGRES